MPSNEPFKNIGIAGAGLIGGSFAKGFYEKGVAVYGFDANPDAVKEGALSGVFEGITDEFDRFTAFPLDLIYICLPVKAAINFIKKLGSSGIKVPVTDSASSKVSVMSAAKEAGLRFCGGHPIKGKEISGFANSEAKLFSGARHILTPMEEGVLADNLKALHESLGMTVSVMEAKLHDEVFAHVSHLPHLASFCLMEAVEESCSDAFAFAGAGFLDFTRIAAGDPVMWADIFTDNSKAVLESVEGLEKVLNRWKNLITQGKYEELKFNISKVSAMRRKL